METKHWNAFAIETVPPYYKTRQLFINNTNDLKQ